MKKNKAIMSITIFIMCIVLTCVVFIQFRTARQTSLTDIENMNEEELKAEIVSLQSRYKDIEEKLNETSKKMTEYNKTLKNNNESSKLVNEELKNLEKIVGKTDVQGDGVVVTLKDNDEQEVTANILLNLVNELKYAGAEAISINGIRIVNMTDIVDVNFIIQIEGQKVSSPYTVKCIGDTQYLESSLNAKEGFVQTYRNSGITVNLENASNIKIEKYNGDIKLQYGKEQ